MSLNSDEHFSSKLFNPSDKIPDFEIDDVMRKALCFRDDLIIVVKDESRASQPLGGYCISLESIGREGNEFMIQVLSSMSVKDCFAGSKVLSSTTSKFHCLEEKRTEYIHQSDGLHEKVLFVGLEDDLYHLECQELCPCDESSWRKDLPLCSCGEMLSEGANVLLMRYLALTNFHGSLSFQSITIDGQITTSNYRCTEAKSTKVNGRIVEVYTIERTIHEECGLIHKTTTHMTLKGKILRHDWLEVPYLLKINSLVDPNKIDSMGARIMGPLTSRWGSDVQMMSMYLDKKTCKMAQQAEYLADHPEIKQLISDYTQTLLAVKPINVLSFTIQHFASFAKNPDPSENITSNESNMDIMSQLSRQKLRRVCSVCGTCFDCIMSEEPQLGSVCNLATPGSRYPLPDTGSRAFSSCSVFSKCPSDASCVRKKLSRCDLYPECEKTCDGCQLIGEPCSFAPDCEKTCKGCQTLRKSCSFSPECEKTCEGCPFLRKSCSFAPDCEKTCKGCETLRKSCSFSPECEKTCKGCPSLRKSCSFAPDCEKTCKGCGTLRKSCSFSPECEKTCQGCPSLRKSCSFAPDCEKPCKGCGTLRKSCSFAPDCEKTCEGCPSFGKSCSFAPECEITCNGCQSLSKSCSFSPECEKTCDGCETLEERCSLYPECKKTCDGCRPLLEPCQVHRACPECPGCHKVCSEIDVCPNCKKCNVEILPEAPALSHCQKCGTANIEKGINLAGKK